MATSLSSQSRSASDHSRDPSGAPSAVVNDKKAWDTRTRARIPEAKVTHPSQAFAVAEVAPSIKEIYERFISSQRAADAIVREESPLHRELDALFSRVLTAASALTGKTLSREDFSFSILHAPQPNAFIYHGEGFKPHVFITTGLLHALKAHCGEIREGHLSMLLGHEIKHFIEGHYLTTSDSRTYHTGQDPLPYERIGTRRAKEEVENLLLQRAFTRNQEFECDEFGLRINRHLGVPLPEGIALLKFLYSLEENEKSQAKPDSRPAAKVKTSRWLLQSITKTHPATETRIFRAQGCVRNLEIESFGLPKGAAKISESRLVALTEPLLTLEQTALQKLSEILKLDASERERRVIQIVDEVASADAPPENILRALNSLYLLAPAYLGVAENILPRQPYSGLVRRPLDDPSERAASTFEQSSRQIGSTIAARIERVSVAQGMDSCRETLATLFSTTLVYPTEDAHALIAERILDSFPDTPLPELLLSVFKEAQRPLSWAAGAEEFLESFAGAPFNCFEHQQFFAQIARHSEIDLRADVLIILLAQGLLEHCNDEGELLATLNTIEREFVSKPEEWERLAPLLGDALVEWVTFTGIDREENRLKNFLSQIRERSPDTLLRADPLVVDLYVFEAARRFTDHLGAQAAWLADTLPAGKTRDLALIKLVETATGWFENSRAANQSFSPLLPWESQHLFGLDSIDGHNRTNQAVHDLVDAMETIAPYLNLSWAAPSVVMSDSFQYNDAPDSTEFEGLTRFSQFEPIAQREEELGVSPTLCQFTKHLGYVLCAPRDITSNEIRFYLRSYIQHVYGATGEEGDPELVVTFFERCRSALPFLFEAHGLAVNTDLSYDDQAAFITALKRDPAYLRMLLSDSLGNNYSDRISYSTLEGLPELIEQLPKGECRDFVIVKALATASQYLALEERLDFLTQLEGASQPPQGFSKGFSDYGRKILSQTRREKGREELRNEKSRFQHFRDTLSSYHGQLIFDLQVSERDRPPVDSHNARFTENALRCLDLLDLSNAGGLTTQVSAPLDRIERLEAVRGVYNNYLTYLALKCKQRAPTAQEQRYSHSFPELRSIAAEVGRVLLEREEMVRPLRQSSPDNQAYLENLARFLPFPSEQRDRYTTELIDEQLPQGSSSIDAAYRVPWVRSAYDLLSSSHVKHDLGRRIYAATLAANPELSSNFETHLDLLRDLHPAGSVSREQALRHFIDNSGGQGAVQTWAQRDLLEARLKADEESLKRSSAKVLRQGGFMMALDAITELDLPAKERVDTVLWAVGLRPKSHLVECIELLEGRQAIDLKDHARKLTEAERKELVRLVLAGPNGLLRSSDRAARKEFLDTLFFTVFQDNEGTHQKNLRSFKAVYDCMLCHIDPERAAEFLGNFLVSHLEGKNLNEQIKTFFESFDFIGIKTAQYLVSATTLIRDELRAVLMDLTSRVEGPPKTSVFDLAEATYGPEARRVIRRVGRRVGGGSLMSFYEVELWNAAGDGPGRRGVIGVLRPDVVGKMPEDLRLVGRLIQTMHEAPEIFGGKHLSTDLMENLAWQSLIETNLERTLRLQQTMRAQLASMEGISVPAAWEEFSFLDQAGSMTTLKLTQGPFIFMDFAPGVTLDLYERQLTVTAPDGTRTLSAEGEQKMKEVATRIAEAFFRQVAEYGLVHCDLHPGNILVSERDGNLHVTLLDVGLSTELSPRLRELCGKMLRVVVGAQSSGSRTEALVRKLWYGTGKVSEADGKAWLSDAVNVFEAMASERWSETQKAAAVNLLWTLLSDKERSPQARLADITEVSRELGIKLPREIYYLIRAASITNHLWKHADWKALQPVLAKLGKANGEAEIPPLNVGEATQIISVINSRINLPRYHEPLVRAYLELANVKVEVVERIKHLKDLFFDISGQDPEKARELLHALAEDASFRKALGLEKATDSLRTLLGEMRDLSAESPENGEAIFVNLDSLPSGRAAERAYLERFGSKVRIWDGILHTGSLIKVTTNSGSASTYVVESPDPLNIHNVDGVLVRPISHYTSIKSGPNRHPALSNTGTELGSFLVEDSRLDSDFNRVALAYSVFFESGELFLEQLKRSEDSRGQVPLSEDSTILATQYIEETLRGDSDAALSMYELLVALSHAEARPLGGVANLGNLMDDPTTKVEVFVRGAWQPVEARLLQRGETREQYFEVLQQERERLGIQ